MGNQRTLILSDGGLASLVACAAAREESIRETRGSPAGAPAATPALVMPFGCVGPTGGPRAQAARAHAEAYGIMLVEPLPIFTAFSGLSPSEAGVHSLLAATAFAARQGCEAVVWPVQAGGDGVPGGVGPDLDRIAQAADRALVISRLVALDAREHRVPGIRVETPYLDLADRQLADLAAEMDVPWKTCWWWGMTRTEGDQASQEHFRWVRALMGVGVRVPQETA